MRMASSLISLHDYFYWKKPIKVAYWSHFTGLQTQLLAIKGIYCTSSTVVEAIKIPLKCSN